MEKMNCDIIRDLIPSYVDEICSEATKKCVEEHVENCGECRLMLASCKNQVLSGKNMEQKGLDGLKQIKGIIQIQNCALYVILAFLLLLGVLLFIFHKEFVAYPTYSVLFAICAVVNVFAGISYKEKKKTGKTELILGVVSLLANVYSVLIFFYLAGMFRVGAEIIFGRNVERIGPFLEKQLTICFAMQIAFFVFNLFGIMKHNKNSNWLLCINMMGMFLAFKYEHLMHLMSGYDTLYLMIERGTAEIVIIGVLGAIVSFISAKAFNKKGREGGSRSF